MEGSRAAQELKREVLVREAVPEGLQKPRQQKEVGSA